MTFWSRKSLTGSHRQTAQPRARLRIEELETRSLMSANPLANTFNNLQVQADQFSSTDILVRWTANAPAATPGGNLLDLGAGLYRVTLSPGQSVAQAVSYYQGLPGVEYATPDYQVQLARLPNDTRFGSLYGLNNTGQTGGVIDADIDAAEAWDITTGSGRMVVAVIDTGVDYNHPDLAANMWRNAGETPGDGIDNDRNGFVDDVFGYDFANNDGNPMDDNGHGTHVAGTIGAVGNNGVGVAGVNWNVKLMALKFLSASGSGSLSNAVRALNYAVQMGAKISNNSYGGGGFFSAMDTAIANARAAGHIFVAAAGNESNNNDLNPSYPANYNYNNVISVAATDASDRIASFSNFGATTVDIAAPGVNILSTTPNNTYSSFSGTSMASPHVAGAVALLWDANPTLTYTQVIDRIYASSDVITGLNGRVANGRRLNVNNALRMGSAPGDTTGASITGVTFNGPNANAINSATVTFSEAINASTFTAADIAFSGPAGTLAVTSVTPVAGSSTSFVVSFATQSANGTYRMVIGPNISDVAGNLMDQNRNGVRGESTDIFTATRTINVPVTQTFTNSTTLAIRDLATVTSSLTVAATGTISDLNVRVNVGHTYVGDLVLTLIAPDGTRVPLASRRGGAGDNFSNTTFDDQATASVVTGAAPFSGSFRPESALSALNGKNLQGTWRLEIRDAAAADIGTLFNWSLIVTTSGAGLRTMSADAGGVTGSAGSDLGDLTKPVLVGTPAPLGGGLGDGGTFSGSSDATGSTFSGGGVSSTPSITWLTSAFTTGVRNLDVVSGPSRGTTPATEITLDTTEEEGVFALSTSEESELEVPASESESFELLGVELL